MINFRNISFVKSAPSLGERPAPRFPEVVLTGRSNVGKSSLINGLTGHKVAKVSATPGKTVLLNYYLVDEAFYMVDAPGYGYAASGSRHVATFAMMMEGYFRDNKELRLVLMLLDARRIPSKNDRELLDLLAKDALPHLLVFTKTDKMNQAETAAFHKMIRELGYDKDKYVLTSTKEPRSYDELKKRVAAAIGADMVAS